MPMDAALVLETRNDKRVVVAANVVIQVPASSQLKRRTQLSES